MSHGGGGSEKCHVLFEWPLKVTNILHRCVPTLLKAFSRNAIKFFFAQDVTSFIPLKKKSSIKVEMYNNITAYD